VPDAYAAAKAINSLVMSLAAIPVYLLARRVLLPAWSVLAAVLALAIPPLLYTGMLMTENAYYPVFLGCVLLLVLVLERPTAARSFALAAALGVAYLTRAQTVALVAAAVTAPALLLLLRRQPLRALLAYRWLYGIVLAGALAVPALEVARGNSPLAALGAYRTAAERHYDTSEAARWLLYHVAHLDLMTCIAPFAALVALVATARRLEARDTAFLAAAVATIAWLTLQVALFASQPAVQRLEERNLFYVAPLLFVALLLWIERGAPRPGVALVAAAIAAALPAALPFERLIDVPATSDTFSLLPLWTVHEWGIPLDRIAVVVALGGAAIASLFALLPRGSLWVLPALALVLFALAVSPIESRLRTASVGALFQGITVPERDWVDRAVPDEEVAVLWTGRPSAFTVWENEFFSRSVGRVLHTTGPVPGALAQSQVTIDLGDGVVRDADGNAIRVPYALGEEFLDGEVVARDERKGLVVVQTDGELRARWAVVGLDADGWAGQTLRYRRWDCSGGTLFATLESDASLFPEPQVVTAVSGDGAEQAIVQPTGLTQLSIPLRPTDGVCNVVFTAARTRVPATVQPGSTDTRHLGVRYLGFDVVG
jgi:hypothetical protein